MNTEDKMSYEFLAGIEEDIKNNPDNWQYRHGSKYHIRRGYKFHSPDNYRVKQLVEEIKGKYSEPYYNTKLTHALNPAAVRAINYLMGTDLGTKIIRHDQTDCVEQLLYEIRRADLDGLTIHSLVNYLTLYGKGLLKKGKTNK